MHEHDDIDVGSDRLRLSAIALERGTTDKGATSGQHGLDPVELDRRHHPVANGDFCADVADSQWLGIEPAQHRAPTAVEAGDPARNLGQPECMPRRLEILAPAESNVTPIVNTAES